MKKNNIYKKCYFYITYYGPNTRMLGVSFSPIAASSRIIKCSQYMYKIKFRTQKECENKIRLIKKLYAQASAPNKDYFFIQDILKNTKFAAQYISRHAN